MAPPGFVVPARERAIAACAEWCGARPRWVAMAPGRVNLIGEHTDYNEGFVLPMAIDAETAIAARPVDEPRVTIESRAFPDHVTFDLTRPIEPGARHWSSYVAGVIAGVQARGVAMPGFRAVIESDVPPGSGLSSSAALEVAMAMLLQSIAGETWDARETARLCQRAEHDFAGVPTGIMDQLIAVLARADHACLIDCRSLAVEHVPLADPDVAILIVNTNVRHDLADGAYAERREECASAARLLGVPALRDATSADVGAAAGRLGAKLHARARHVVSENARVHAAAAALGQRQWGVMGALMYESHRSLKDDFEVSCVELDVLVDAARDMGEGSGVFGCRMTGGGFGGSVVALVRRHAAPEVERHLAAAYRTATGRTATAFRTRPGPGAHAETL